MNRKDFLKNGLLGTGLFVASKSHATNLIETKEKSDKDQSPENIIGFNHIPNQIS